MRTPNLSEVLEEVDEDGLRRLTRISSLRSASMLRAFPEGVIAESEDARIVPARGLCFRRELASEFAKDSMITATLRAEPENEHDKNAVAVDFDGVHIGFLPKEIAAIYQPLVMQGRARVAALWKDFSREIPALYLVVAWSLAPVEVS